MSFIWNSLKYTFTIGLILALAFTSGVFGVLLVAKMTNQDWAMQNYYMVAPSETAGVPGSSGQGIGGAEPEEPEPPAKPEKKPSAMLTAPAIRQHPELPAGCEIVSLTMLLQYAGIDKNKMEMAEEMPKDATPLQRSANGTITHWGDPNTGFVGDVYGKSRGFSIYHKGLFPLLAQYIPTAVDLTGEPFERLEEHISNGAPVVAWTTINFQTPTRWVTWESANGPIHGTFSVHAVLLVGYDEHYVYANDPWTGQQNVKVDKERFLATWETMGKQALSYEI